ncbi:Nif3-like dinuclear metal center hexameric protein [Alkalibacterium olivapovliticus]|uniref:GTP cyclohydrolase 1 type 2 homolog n=1 Tax=Alkalibacterium olivapovliticus TaxID=99907 RepID=A0A2T0W9C1_9LACT|nr:Nif3-like dinuclear metal center hexameric protein [Alkalibacterium olivapovliticus]PRY83297.1 dinuclear metal center YbgI/SA1388 family protein [Alkalibacterium olivapovliticus]
MSAVTVKDLVEAMDALAPPSLAEDWDPIGLSFGSLDKEVSKVMIALDVDNNTIQEAIDEKVDLMITHHPAIFKPLKTLNSQDPRRLDYINLIKSDIAVYSAHTNLDAAESGMNDWLADSIGMSQSERTIVSLNKTEGYKKLAVYVPDYAAEKVRKALHEAGAGEVGDYKDVSYTLEGQGRFTPQEGSDPTDGEIGREELTHEQRIEMLVKDKWVYRVIDALKAAHPYEEPVFDLLTLENQTDSYGFGRVGTIEKPKSTEEMAHLIQSLFHIDGVRYGATSKMPHKTAAIFGGSGAKYYKDALKKGATLFITGDVSYHDGQDMLRDGIEFIDAGHYIESICVPELFAYFNRQKEEHNWSVDIIESKTQKDVFTYLR